MLQLSTAVRNARLNAIAATLGVSAHLRIFTGAPPADCSQPETGTLLADIVLPNTYLEPADSGAVAMSGSWQGAGLAVGNAGYFRLVGTDDATCGLQGTVTVTGGGGDLTVDAVAVAIGQNIAVTGFSLTDANA